ncbi:MAG TPA: DUF4286 family protein [Gemmatimonadales bacterium]|jgi:hypothetical protein|nr:DUF4286 family protein [Gemmatimonadales bacterium]
MIAYEVTVDVEEGLVESYITYMRSRHIPAALATGCFAHAEFDRATETRFRQRYLAATLADLEGYLERHAPGLRADYARHFPAGTSVTREIWEEVGRWTPPRKS